MIFSSIDFETTGIPSEDADDGNKHAIVEIGECPLIVRDDNTTIVGYPNAVLCNPGRPIDHGAMATHHITDEMVADATGDLSFVPAEVDYYVAHNADFEKKFWTPGRPIICTYKVALRLWPDAESHKLQFLRYHLGLNANEYQADPPHRAGPDSYMCALLMERIIREQRASIEDMVRWSGGIALLHRINFGKHRGMLWQDLPTGYLEWIRDLAPDMEREKRANAAFRLKQRREASQAAQTAALNEQQKERLL